MARWVLILVALLAGCGMHETNRIVPGVETTLTGEGHFGWEWSYFQPQGETEKYWVEGSAPMMEKLRELYPNQPSYMDKPVKATFRGVVSGPGKYGHLGGYEYKFTVIEVVEMKLPERVKTGG